MDNNHNSGMGSNSMSLAGFSTSLPASGLIVNPCQTFFNDKELKSKENNDFYFSIYNSIKNYQKLPSNMGSLQKLNPYIQRLKREGYIKKLGYGVWTVMKDWQQLKKDSQDDKIRAHGFHYKIRLPRIPYWHKREEFLIREKITYKSFNKHQSFEHKGFTIWLCDKVLIVYSDKSYYGKIAEEGFKYALYDLEQLLQSLESWFGVSLKYNKQYRVRVCKQHYGKIKDSLAQQCNRNNIKIRCYYEEEGWLLIDNSLNLNELETDNPNTSMQDMDKVVIPFFNSLKEHYAKTGESIKITELIKLSALMVEDRKFYAENMNSHVKAVQELAKGVIELRNQIKKINTAHMHQHQTKLNGW